MSHGGNAPHVLGSGQPRQPELAASTPGPQTSGRLRTPAADGGEPVEQCFRTLVRGSSPVRPSIEGPLTTTRRTVTRWRRSRLTWDQLPRGSPGFWHGPCRRIVSHKSPLQRRQLLHLCTLRPLLRLGCLSRSHGLGFDIGGSFPRLLRRSGLRQENDRRWFRSCPNFDGRRRGWESSLGMARRGRVCAATNSARLQHNGASMATGLTVIPAKAPVPLKGSTKGFAIAQRGRQPLAVELPGHATLRGQRERNGRREVEPGLYLSHPSRRLPQSMLVSVELGIHCSSPVIVCPNNRRLWDNVPRLKVQEAAHCCTEDMLPPHRRSVSGRAVMQGHGVLLLANSALVLPVPQGQLVLRRPPCQLGVGRANTPEGVAGQVTRPGAQSRREDMLSQLHSLSSGTRNAELIEGDARMGLGPRRGAPSTRPAICCPSPIQK